jgi:hypothetical protein
LREIENIQIRLLENIEKKISFEGGRKRERKREEGRKYVVGIERKRERKNEIEK